MIKVLKNTASRLLILLVIAVFGFTAFLNIGAPQQASANGNSGPLHPIEEARIHAVYNWLTACGERYRWQTGQELSRIQDGEVFLVYLTSGASNAGVGYTFANDISETRNGRYRCSGQTTNSSVNKNPGNLLNSIGITNLSDFFIVDSNLYELREGTSSDYDLVDVGNIVGLPDTDVIDQKLADTFNQYFPQLSRPISPGSEPGAASLHFAAVAAFTSGDTACGEQVVGGGGRSISIVDQNGEVNTSSWGTDDSSSRHAVAHNLDNIPEETRQASQGLLVAYRGAYINIYMMNCSEIADLINRTADAAANVVAAYNSAIGEDESPSLGLSDAPEETCADTDGLGWMLCPLVSMVSGAFEFLGNQIDRMLVVPLDQYSEAGMREAWTAFRNIAYILLVPIMLIMVISTALGFEFISVYTARKAFPRMVIAAIFIAFSWEIVLLLVDITHTIGLGMRGIVLGPFNITGGFPELFSTGGASTASQWAILGGGIVLIGLSSTVLGILFSFLGTIALVLGTIFLFLVARELFIIGLAIVAPLAILSWIFADRTKLWGAWWRIFYKLLLIYPIIMFITSVGLVFAYLIDGAGVVRTESDTAVIARVAADGADRIITPLFKVAAFVVPFFLIPLAFKYVGGVLGNLAGMVNDKERGMFDRLKKQRQGLYKQGGDQLKSGTLTNRGGQVGEGIGRGLGRLRSGPRGWVPGRSGRRHAEGVMAGARNVQAAEAAKDPRLQQLALSDDHGNAVLALSGGTNQGAEQASRDLMAGWIRQAEERGETVDHGRLEEQRRRALASARGTGINKGNAQVAMGTMMQNKARSVGGGDWATVQSGIDRLHGANTTAAEQQSNYVQYLGREAGRADLGYASAVDGGGVQADAQGTIRRAGTGKIMAGYGAAVQYTTADSARRFNENLGAGRAEDTIEAAAELAAFRNSANPTTGTENKEILSQSLMDAGIDLSDSRTVDQQLAGRIAQSEGVDAATPEGQQRVAQISSEIRNRATLYESVDPRTRGTDDGAPPPADPPPT